LKQYLFWSFCEFIIPKKNNCSTFCIFDSFEKSSVLEQLLTLLWNLKFWTSFEKEHLFLRTAAFAASLSLFEVLQILQLVYNYLDKIYFNCVTLYCYRLIWTLRKTCFLESMAINEFKKACTLALEFTAYLIIKNKSSENDTCSQSFIYYFFDGFRQVLMRMCIDQAFNIRNLVYCLCCK